MIMKDKEESEMGKNKTTKSDGVAVENKTQKLENVNNKPKGAFKRGTQGPK